MITPVNGHILIEPLAHKTYLPSVDGKDTYEEVGVVIKVPEHTCLNGTDLKCNYWEVHGGERVYFDSWLASKYPTGDEDKFFWLVNWSDVRAIERNENPIPK
jgi:hypothetical protein